MDLLLPLLLVALLIPMFLGVRRQKREMAKVTEMRDNLKVGDRVVTTSGMLGTVTELDDSTVDLEIAEDVITTWERRAILEVRNEETAETEDAADDTADAAPADTVTETVEDAPKLTKD
ncbi:preprotein translocase subunit YajC [Nocardia yamanashiensis]|uniref:preprotein translocase subunit YajC n=1 Tax=Nocardia yamanashiensis TaxID=209247 RepID=UPI00082E84E2|nr:preprotein translocase subunit YajC [Nocardia yamanashiensis]UGT42952.1 preprotein translocase subunit YajC [Nocardia yamanashiensis]